MKCPRCQKVEITASGICSACGFQLEIAAQRAESSSASPSAVSQAASSASAALHPSSDSSEEEELPEWRRELTRRLQRLREKRVQEEPGGEASPPDASALPIKIQAQDASQTDEISSTDTSQTHELRRSGRSRTFKVESAAEKSARAPKREATRKAATHEEPVTPSSEQGAPGADSVPEVSSSIPPERAPASSEAESNEIQNLIDSIIARKVSQPIPAPPVGDLPFSVPVPGAYQIDLRQGDKLILLSRTLSGLVDIIVVTLCGSACVLGADIVSGIVIVDRMSVLNYSILLTAIFFLYSLYFLGTANQTIGMMITELRVADDQRKRPTIGRILLRCVAFLISLLGLGIGLIWGFFDDESECLHDKISRTRVARLSWPPTPTQSP